MGALLCRGSILSFQTSAIQAEMPPRAALEPSGKAGLHIHLNIYILR